MTVLVSVPEIIITVILFIWVMLVVGPITRRIYDAMVSRGVSVNKAIYYNRKIIHILGGGLVAILVPYIYKTPVLPFILAMIFAVLTYLPHRKGKLMYWFQASDNVYEVHFCIMWGIIILLSWIIFEGNFWYGVVPVLFMAIGDAVTGIVRNILYGKRTKSWYGNIAMLAVTIPIGAIIGLAGIIAAIVASIVEHFEFKHIDDNITVPLSAFLTILIVTRIL